MTTVPPLVLKHSAPWRRFPLLAFVPLVLAAAVLAAFYFTGTAPADLTTPALGLGGLAVAVGLLLALVGLVATANERRRIAQVRANAWAVFPQYPDQQAWRAYAEAQWRYERKLVSFPWASVVAVVLLFGVITAVSASMLKAPPALFAGVGAMLALILGGLVLSTQASRWAADARYRRRRSMSAPVVYVAERGMYHEDHGFDTLRRLEDVRFQPAGAARRLRDDSDAYFEHVLGAYGPVFPQPPTETFDWGELRFTIRTWRARRPFNWREIRVTTAVRVPPGREGDAVALVERYKR
jgi:hypothetical protein